MSDKKLKNQIRRCRHRLFNKYSGKFYVPASLEECQIMIETYKELIDDFSWMVKQSKDLYETAELKESLIRQKEKLQLLKECRLQLFFIENEAKNIKNNDLL